MLDSPPGNFGIEFYSGDPYVIAEACQQPDWSALRAGELTRRHVVFPVCVYSLDISLLPDVVSSLTGTNVHIPIGDVPDLVGIEGCWGASIMPREWVKAMASVSVESSNQFHAEWTRIHNREFEDEPNREWETRSMMESCAMFLRLVTEANREELSVVEIWAL